MKAFTFKIEKLGEIKLNKMKKLLIKKPAMLFFALILLLTSFTIYSCSKTSSSNSNTTTTVAQDQEFITSSFNSTSTCISDIVNGNGAQSLITFLKLSNGNTGNSNWINEMTNALDSVWPQSTKTNGSFDYKAYCGTYTWNPNSGTFTVTPSNTITIKFPSDSTVTTNDIVATFQSYTEAEYQVNSQNQYFPTSAVISITKAGTKIAGVNYSGTFSNGDFPTPQNVSLDISLAPYDYTISVKQINSTQFQLNATLGCSSVLNSTISFSNSDYKNFQANTYLSNITFTYTKDNLIVSGNWDAKTYYGLNNPSTSDINTTFVSTVYNGTEKIGTLQFVDVAGSRQLFVFYKDGTSANTSFNYNPFLTSVKGIFRPYFGSGVDDWF